MELYIIILREFEDYEFCDRTELSRLKLDSFVQWFNKHYRGYTLDEWNRIIQELQRRL